MRPQHCHHDSHGQVPQSFNQTPYLPAQSSAALPRLQSLRVAVMKSRYIQHPPITAFLWTEESPVDLEVLSDLLPTLILCISSSVPHLPHLFLSFTVLFSNSLSLDYSLVALCWSAFQENSREEQQISNH